MAINTSPIIDGTSFAVIRENINDNFNEIKNYLDNSVSMVIGSYVGDGQEERLINLGFKPAAVEVWSVPRVAKYSNSYGELRIYDENLKTDYNLYSIVTQGIITDKQPIYKASYLSPAGEVSTPSIEQKDSGFSVYQKKMKHDEYSYYVLSNMNAEGQQYYFKAYKNIETMIVE